jgi:hypothetical protein
MRKILELKFFSDQRRDCHKFCAQTNRGHVGYNLNEKELILWPNLPDN